MFASSLLSRELEYCKVIWRRPPAFLIFSSALCAGPQVLHSVWYRLLYSITGRHSMLYCRLCVLYCTAGPASVPYKDYCTLYCITGPSFCTVLQSCTLQYIILNSVLDKQVQNHAFYCGSGILYCPAGTASASYFSSCFCTLLPVLYSAPFRRSCILYRLKILHFIVLNLLHWKGHLSKPS